MRMHMSVRIRKREARMPRNAQRKPANPAPAPSFWRNNGLSLVVLSIWLRQKDSPQSKPVDAPHAQTGD
jgi:hypothetical protein